MTKRGKGFGGSCCCDGCSSSPSDGRDALDSEYRARQIKTKCCRCVPNNVCVNLSEINFSTSQDMVITKYCNTAPYDGDTIEYSEDNFLIDGTGATLNIRLIVPTGVNDSGCYIGFDIPEISVSGQTLIDHNVAYSGTGCGKGMSTKQCVEFGGSWDFTYNSNDYTISVTGADTTPLKDKVCCASCDCICRCMCLSVWGLGENLSVVLASNEIVCATEVTNSGYEYCSGVYSPEECHSYTWTHPSGYVLSIDGSQKYGRLTDHSVCVGTGQVIGCECPPSQSGWTVASGVKNSITYSGDDFYHVVSKIENQANSGCSPYGAIVSGVSPNINALYEFSVNHDDYDNNVASYFTWVGRSHYEDSTTIFSAYDFTGAKWDVLQTHDTGRASGVTYPVAVKQSLESIYTGTTGADKGKVKLGLQSASGNFIYTDMLRVTPLNTCCKMKLELPEISGFQPIESFLAPKTLFSYGDNACPNPDPSWTISGSGGGGNTIGFLTVSANCSWCNGTCNSVITQCCNRQLPKTLFAEVDIDCYNCGGVPCTVPLINQIGGMWEAPDSFWCCEDEEIVSMSLSCGNSGVFVLSMQVNACTYSGSVTASGCDPLNIVFAGTLANGLGCCGPSEGPSVTPGVTITIVE